MKTFYCPTCRETLNPTTATSGFCPTCHTTQPLRSLSANAGRQDWLTIRIDDPVEGLYAELVTVLEESHASASVLDEATRRRRTYYDHQELGEFVVEAEGAENDEVVFEAPEDMVQEVLFKRVLKSSTPPPCNICERPWKDCGCDGERH